MNSEDMFASELCEETITFDKVAQAIEAVSSEDLEDILSKTAGPSGLFAAGGALAKGTLARGVTTGLAKNIPRAAAGGAALGAARGAINPGYDQMTGRPNSMIGGALRGAAGGALLGAGAGAASRAGLAYAAGGTTGVQKVMGGMGRQLASGAQRFNQQAGQALQKARTAVKAPAVQTPKV